MVRTHCVFLYHILSLSHSTHQTMKLNPSSADTSLCDQYHNSQRTTPFILSAAHHFPHAGRVQEHKLTSKAARKAQARETRNSGENALHFRLYPIKLFHLGMKQSWSTLHWVDLWAYFCIVSLLPFDVHAHARNPPRKCYACVIANITVNHFRPSSLSALACGKESYR